MRPSASLLSFVVLVSAAAASSCAASPPASFPPKVDLPIAPEPHAEAASGAKEAAPLAPAPKATEPTRPVAVRVTVPSSVQAMVDASDRDEADRALDGGRHPGELLAFLGLKPGDRVAELAVGGGYTTELLARAVGPKGKVWGENNAFIMKFAEPRWGERLKKPAMKNVIRADRELDAPLPPDAKNLDAVVVVLFYHDTVWMGVDRDKMNKAVFDALKRGGQYVIVDHSAPEGSGTADVKTTHRIDELFALREVERSGFQHVITGDFLRNPADTRDWNDSPREAGARRGTSDRFVLKFIKP